MSEVKKAIPELRFTGFISEWETKKLSDIALKITDGTHDTPKPTETGVPYITAIHVKDGNISFEDSYYLTQHDHDKIYRRCNPVKGDLLIVNIGSGTATSAIIDVDFEFSMKNVALIKPNHNLVYPNFLSQVQRMHSKRLNHQLTSGGAQPFLSLKTIGKISHLFPIELKEQKKISYFLSALDKKNSQLIEKHDMLLTYKKGLMQQIFSRQIRFKDDNGNDYPEWVKMPLSEVCNLKAGKFVAAKNIYRQLSNEFFPCFGGNGLRGYTKTFTHDGFFPLIGRQGALCGNIQLAKGKFHATEHAITVIPVTDNDALFLYFQLSHLDLNRFATGQAQPGLSVDVIERVKARFPSFKEQQKIANFLLEIDHKIDLAKSTLEQTKLFKKGLLQKMFV